MFRWFIYLCTACDVLEICTWKNASLNYCMYYDNAVDLHDQYSMKKGINNDHIS